MRKCQRFLNFKPKLLISSPTLANVQTVWERYLEGKAASLHGVLSSTLENGCYGDLRCVFSPFPLWDFSRHFPHGPVWTLTHTALLFTVIDCTLGAPQNHGNGSQVVVCAVSSPQIWAGSCGLL